MGDVVEGIDYRVVKGLSVTLTVVDHVVHLLDGAVIRELIANAGIAGITAEV